MDFEEFDRMMKIAARKYIEEYFSSDYPYHNTRTNIETMNKFRKRIYKSGKYRLHV